jgi:hypothetical protein
VLGQTAVSADTFSYEAPVISSTTPTELPTIGTALVINGVNFGSQGSFITLRVNGGDLADFSVKVRTCCAIRAIRAIRIPFTGFRLWYNISAPLSVPHLLRVVAGEALRRFRAAQEHPGLAGDQG